MHLNLDVNEFWVVEIETETEQVVLNSFSIVLDVINRKRKQIFYINDGCLLIVRSVLLGLTSNSTVNDVELNLSGNALGVGGSQVLEDCLPTAANISTLDLSDNGNSLIVSTCLMFISYLVAVLLFIAVTVLQQ